ncbi:hypothetical protein JOD97_000844 [Duganella sp. 1411]|uniref:hypothetical protein n=1 Tax=Duganella sp. 1411 TaxID=2806572 RepID=UPI001AE1A77D|nr:hypothetical protein [Duganella sp. 1411]MBP1202830.1 hypothetical protein [Duganella sp. 1411]
MEKKFKNGIPVKRRNLMLAACGFLLLNACEAKDMRVVLDLVVFNYLDRPIFAVNVDGIGYEVSGAYPETGKTTTTGFALKLGPKIVTWKLDGPKGAPRIGERVHNKNALELSQNQIVPGAKFISVHIYPDDTVELITSVNFPHATARGEKEAAKMGDRHGK